MTATQSLFDGRQEKPQPATQSPDITDNRTRPRNTIQPKQPPAGRSRYSPNQNPTTDRSNAHHRAVLWLIKRLANTLREKTNPQLVAATPTMVTQQFSKGCVVATLALNVPLNSIARLQRLTAPKVIV